MPGASRIRNMNIRYSEVGSTYHVYQQTSFLAQAFWIRRDGNHGTTGCGNVLKALSLAHVTLVEAFRLNPGSSVVSRQLA